MQFEVTAVGSVLSHEADVLFEGLVVHKTGKLVWPLGEVVARLLTQLCVSAWVAVELVGESPEEAVAVACRVGGIQPHALELCVEIALHLLGIV